MMKITVISTILCIFMSIYLISAEISPTEQSLENLSPFDALSLGYKHHLSRQLKLNYTNAYDTFKPSAYMVMVQSISGQPFPLSMSSIDMTYLIAVFIVPAILFVLGILSMFFFNCGLLFRCCCFCCKCLPKFSADVGNEERVKTLKYHRTTILVFFYIFCFLTLLADQLSYVGNTSITLGEIVNQVN